MSQLDKLTGLAAVKGRLGYESLQILVVGPDFDSRSSFEVMTPLFKAIDDSV